MKKQILFIHGGTSFSKHDNFLRYLENLPLDRVLKADSKRWPENIKSLQSEDCEVFYPKMPNTQNSKYEEWKIWFERHFEVLHDELILMGWSQGGLFLLKYLSENKMPVQIKTLFLVAPVFVALVDEKTQEDGGDFNFDTSQVGKVGNQVSDIQIFHSKDDFVVPYEHSVKLQAALPKATLHTFEDRNHFLQEEFPEIIDLLKQV